MSAARSVVSSGGQNSSCNPRKYYNELYAEQLRVAGGRKRREGCETPQMAWR